MAGPRRFLLYCPTKGSQYTGDFFGHDRLFDVALNDWTGIGMDLEPAEYVFAERSHKWPCIKANLPKLDAQYDYYAFHWIVQAFSRQPEHSVYLHNCGFALEQMGREVEALVFYRQSLALAPDYREARTSLERLTQPPGSANSGSE